MRLVLHEGADDFMSFKKWFYAASSKDISKLYQRTAHLQEIQGETDLNQQCIDRILETISTDSVLEVGCGRGYLANLVGKNHPITACDIVIPSALRKKYPHITFVQGDIEKLPFRDNQFETVISTHTLEHTKNLPAAVAELRRVASKELIIVVPRQRPYRYTFSLHTQFFPYDWSITNAFGYRKSARIERLGDWLYYERTDT